MSGICVGRAVKTIERDWGDVLYALQIPPSLASLSATKFLLQIYMELTDSNTEFAILVDALSGFIHLSGSEPSIYIYSSVIVTFSLLAFHPAVPCQLLS